jgi:hypothetical protein
VVGAQLQDYRDQFFEEFHFIEEEVSAEGAGEGEGVLVIGGGNGEQTTVRLKVFSQGWGTGLGVGGHVQIHDQDLRLKFASEANGLREIAGFTHELQMRFAVEKTADGFSNNFGIVSEKDFDWQEGLVIRNHKRDNIADSDPSTIPTESAEGKSKVIG